MMFGNGYGIRSCFGFGYGLMHGGSGMIMMLGFAIVVLAAVSIILFTKKIHRHQTDSLALETLKMRLAKGEITEEEYFRRKTVLE